MFAGVAFAACGTAGEAPGDLEVAGYGAELRDSDGDGKDDYNDSWRFAGRGAYPGHRRNKCPIVQAFAFPQSIQVGQVTKLRGFALDNDGPRSLRFEWNVSPATIGKIATPTSKRSDFKCLQPGVAHITFSATDGDCTRLATVKVYCKGTTPAVCGDGKVDPGEICDGNCPTTCDDNNACTADALKGGAATCDAQCTHGAVTACTSGDQCCPSGCSNPGDADCQPTCGNGTVDPGETCDGNCPTTCNDNNACTTDTLTGSAATCNVACERAPVTACTTGDGCCPSACSRPGDTDCAPKCGDGVVDANETCDGNCATSCNDNNACTTDVLTGAANLCNVTCTNTAVTVCSATADQCCDKTLCNATNDVDCMPTCGNGTVEPSETCDGNCPASCDDSNPCTTDTRTGSPDQCNVECRHTAITVCASGDSCCAAGCKNPGDLDCPYTPECGNGIVDPGESCDGNCPATCDDNDACTDDITVGGAATCDLVCRHTPKTTIECTCGNGTLDSGEVCDGNCPTLASCDDNNPCTADSLSGAANTCDARCVNTPIPACTQCGNGIVEAGETCDGNCPTSCTAGTNACTPNRLTGSPLACNVKCEEAPITTCTNSDMCCPTAVSCGPQNDNDCSDPCKACESVEHDGSFNCLDSSAAIDGFQGVDANGTPLSTLARAALDCFHRRQCARTATTDCFCGPGVDPNTCFNSPLAQAVGLCRDEVIAAALTTPSATTVMGDVQNRFFDTSVPIGAAVSMIETCDQFFCVQECL